MEFLDVCKSRQPGGQGETAASGGGGSGCSRGICEWPGREGD